jgi:UDP-3-O-[3-hydroxymyristoyl] glucosamine N-acyltransferase
LKTNRRRYVIVNLKVEEQHRHKNPDGSLGGWVAETASVEPSVFVGEHALVYGEAVLTDHVRILDLAQVSGKAKISGHAVVSGNAWVDKGTYSGNEHLCKNERKIEKQERIK